MEPDADWKSRLERQADRVRSSGAIGKSLQMRRLFDFLVERSLAGAAPKETELAQEVFGIPIDSNFALDATVRANIHRLRKKLDDLPSDGEPERLVLPRGEYRLILLPYAPGALKDGSLGLNASSGGRGARWRWVAAASIGLAVLAATWLWAVNARPADGRLESVFWKSLTNSHFPTMLVAGDYYLFGEFNAQGKVARLIHDPRIPSREALDRGKMKAGGGSLAFVDLDYHYLPEAMTPALTFIAPILRAAGGDMEQPAPLGASRFATGMLNKNNIVYLGLLSGLGVLRDPFFEGSGFMLAADGSFIADRASRRRYQSDWADPSEERLLRHDYAYVASRPGPFGNRLLIIAGISDPGLVEAAQIAANRTELDQLSGKAGSEAFEALYEVRTFGPSNYSSRLIMARPFPGSGGVKAKSRQDPRP